MPLKLAATLTNNSSTSCSTARTACTILIPVLLVLLYCLYRNRRLLAYGVLAGGALTDKYLGPQGKEGVAEGARHRKFPSEWRL